MYNKFKQIFSVIGTFLLVSLIPIITFAENSATANIAKQYNSNILNSIGNQFLTTPFLQWNGPLLSTLFGICLIISLSQAFSMQGSAQFMRLLDLAVYGFIALALLGQPTAYNATKGLFEVSDPVKYPGSGVSLDRDIFNWTAENADNMADAFFGENLTEKLITASYETSVFVNGLIEAKTSCTDANIGCMKKYLDPKMRLTPEEEKAKKDLEAKNIETYGGWNQIGQVVALVFNFVAKIYDPFAWFFPLLLWIFDIIRSAVNLFVLIGFGIITAFALFMAKLFVPFIILPGYRQQIYKGFRFVLSVTLFGFVTSLIIFMSIAITTAMTQAGRDTFLGSIATNQGIKMSDMLSVLTSLFIGQLVIAAIQIVALIKVPKIAENIVNLSMDSVVGLGTELVSAAGGLARGIAGVAAMAAGVPLAGMAASLGSAAKGAGGAITQGLNNKFPGIRKSMPGFDKLTGQGGGSGGGSEFGTSSLSSAARDMAAKESTQSASRSSGASFSQDDAIRKVKTPAGSKKDKDSSTEEESSGAKIWEVGKKVAGEAMNLGIDSIWAGTTGKVPDVSRVVKRGLVGSSAMLKQARENYTSEENQSRIQESTRAATARTLNKLGMTTTTEEERLLANETLRELTKKKELTGENFDNFNEIKNKHLENENLESEDVDNLIKISQTSNLSKDQKKLTSEIMSKQFDIAAKNKDYEQMYKLSNSNVAKERLKNKNSQIQKIDQEYNQYSKNISAETSSAIRTLNEDPSVNKENTKDAVSKIIQMTQAGLINSDHLMDQSGESIKKSNEEKARQDIDRLNELVKKFNENKKFDNLDELNEFQEKSENQKYRFDNNEKYLINKIRQETGSAKLKVADFNPDSETKQMVEDDIKMIKQQKKMAIGSDVFFFNEKGFDDAGYLKNGSSEQTNFKKVSKENVRLLEDKIEMIEAYMNELNEFKLKNPNKKVDETHINEAREIYKQAKAILEAIKK